MKGAWLEHGQVSSRDLPTPDPPDGHALLRLIAGGICNTDLELQRGYYGFSGVPGHEFVAEVVATGQRVVGEINLACGHCDWCTRDLGRHCPQRTVLGIVRHPGAFAEFFTLPVRNLLPVPDHVKTEHAVFTEPVAAACEILDQVAIPARSEIAVLGDGKLGLLIGQVLAAHGHRVHQFGRHANKLRIAALAGADISQTNRLFRYVVDATGSAEGLAQAIRMTEPRGVLIMKSTIASRVAIDTAPIIVNEVTLVGSRCGRFAPALDLIASGRLHLDEMIDGRYPLPEVTTAFAHAATRGTLKILLDN
ncbi:MAG: alcohol dehydrogenase catalytic domain-containing protein [Bryobacteraceae bacterium]|nr:alcohol dehydrogenase catalytic domain-containing protein [Bryobacteraceae bacterium]